MTTPTDVELISIAAGERQMTGFWRMRGWALAYVVTWGRRWRTAGTRRRA
jgi:hypothetical protein